MNTTQQQGPPENLFFKIFTVVFLIVAITTTAITFILPESYASTVRIKVKSDPSNANGPMGYGGYYGFPQVTFEIIQSELVLSNAIAKLDLNDTWGKMYFNGEMLKTSETMQILKQRMEIGPVKNTELIYITVYSDDPNEAAQIANAVAEAYLNYRITSWTALTTNGIGVLQQQYEKQATQIAQAESELESLRQQFKIASDATASQSPQEQPYWDKKRDLAQLTELHKLLYSKLEGEKLVSMPNVAPAVIVDPAVPVFVPVKPNKPLNIAIGVVAGIVLGSIIGGLAALFAAKTGKVISAS